MPDLWFSVHCWMERRQVPGVAFSLNESVQVLSGAHAGCHGSVVSLVKVEPAVAYRVELSSGEDVDIEQSSLIGASALADAVALAQLQRWYAAQCDGDWEHTYGVKIDTLDNPGWVLKVDLEGTRLENRTFSQVEEFMNEPDWLSCRVRDGKFEGAGGPGTLSRAIRIFVEWAEREEPA